MILLHPRESRRTIGTARLVQLCLPETQVLKGTGEDFDKNADLAAILADPTLSPYLLFPGTEAVDVESVERESPRRPVFLIVDGTWSQARKMIRTSEVLRRLPCVKFSPTTPSRYGFRRQPAIHCLSTIEAVHEVITRIHGAEGPHETLLTVFTEMVKFQTSFPDGQPGAVSYRRKNQGVNSSSATE